MHFYPFHLKDYVAATAHLTPLEDICYRRLLDLAYETESPLTADHDVLARRIRMAGEGELVGRILDEFWSFHKGQGWRHERVDTELRIFEQRSTNAKKAARTRWGSGRKRRMQPHSAGNADAMLPKNQEPSPIVPTVTTRRHGSAGPLNEAVDRAAANAERRAREGSQNQKGASPLPVKKTKAEIAKIHEPKPIEHAKGMEPGNPSCECRACIAVRQLRNKPSTA
jgi:uncharacterized protein YdaU (DUF1376 family)